MSNLAKPFLGLVALSLITILAVSGPALAITAELAKQCQVMAAKVHPMVLPGSKVGTAKAERDYFSSCIKNNGTMPDNDNQKTAAPTAK